MFPSAIRKLNELMLSKKGLLTKYLNVQTLFLNQIVYRVGS